mgnify:CR=1 FL=1
MSTARAPIRVVLAEDHTIVREGLRALLDVRDDIEVVVMHQDVGLENEFGGPLVDAMTRMLDRHDPGAPVLPYLLGGGTDNKALSLLGITGYGFAPLKLTPELDFPAMFHGVDERVPLDALVFGRRVLGDLLLEY